MSTVIRAPGSPPPPSFISVLKQVTAEEGRHGVIETFPENVPVPSEFDDMTPPLSQSRWFQTSAKAVRMSVLAHMKRAESRNKVNKQLREWADNKVAGYSDVDIDNMELIDMDQLDMDDQGPICPSARGLGADLKQQWYSAIDEEVRKKLKEKEESMKAAVQAELDMVEDLRDNVKALKADLKEANGRAAALENDMLRQKVSQASGADRRKELSRELEEARAALTQAAQERQDAADAREAAAQATAAAHELEQQVLQLNGDLATQSRAIEDLERRIADAHAAQSEAADRHESATAQLHLLQQQAGNTANVAAESQQKDARIEELARLVEECQNREADIKLALNAAHGEATSQQSEARDLRATVTQLQQVIQRQDALLNGANQEAQGAVSVAQREVEQRIAEQDAASALHQKDVLAWQEERRELHHQIQVVQEGMEVAASDLRAAKEDLRCREETINQLQKSLAADRQHDFIAIPPTQPRPQTIDGETNTELSGSMGIEPPLHTEPIQAEQRSVKHVHDRMGREEPDVHYVMHGSDNNQAQEVQATNEIRTKSIISVSDCVICAVRNAVSYCGVVRQKVESGDVKLADQTTQEEEQDALYIQVALHVLHALATFMGDVVKENSDPSAEPEHIIQHLHRIQSSAHDIVSAHAVGEALPAESGMTASQESMPMSVNDDARMPSHTEAVREQISLSALSRSRALQAQQPLTALPMSLAHFAEFGLVPPEPTGRIGHQSWSTHAANTQSTGGEEAFRHSRGRDGPGSHTKQSWLQSHIKPRACSHILFQPPAPPAHAFPHRTARHRRFVPPATHPPYLDTITPLSVASTFSALAPAGGDPHLSPSTLWSMLDGAVAPAEGPPDTSAPPVATLAPPLAAFAPPRPVQRACWNLAVQRPRLRSQSPPRTRSPPGDRTPQAGQQASTEASGPPRAPQRAAGVQAAAQRARSGPGEQLNGSTVAQSPGLGGLGEARRGGADARLPTWEPHLQPQVGGSSPSGWAMSNRVTVANPQKGFRNRPPRPHSARARVQSCDGSEASGGTGAMASPLGRAAVAITEVDAAANASHAVPARGISLARLDHPRQRSAPLSRAQRLQEENRELAQLYLGTLSQLRDAMEEQEALAAALRDKETRMRA